MNSLFIHSQSNMVGPDAEVNASLPLTFDGVPEEQAFETRALAIAANRPQDVYVTNFPIPDDYADYLQNLNIVLPQVVIINDGHGNLSQDVIHSPEILARLLDILGDQKAILSTFTPTAVEQSLAKILQTFNPNFVTEFSDTSVAIVNKLFTDIILKGEPGLRYGTETLYPAKLKKLNIDSGNELKAYLEENHPGKRLLFKHPFGTAGEGLWGMDSIDYIYDLIVNNNGIVVEEFFTKEGVNTEEHSLHFYIDPVNKEVQYIGTYDQLVEPTGHGGYAHVGCVYPSQNLEHTSILQTTMSRLAARLIDLGMTGYVCADVLVNDDGETHVMEINPRAGANLYALRLAQTVTKSIYGESHEPFFYFQAGISIPQAKSVDELVQLFPELEALLASGQLILHNYARFQFGKWDMIFNSINSHGEADTIRKTVLEILSKSTIES